MTSLDVASPESQTRRFARVRDRLASSPLIGAGGLLRTRILDETVLTALVSDAEQAHRHAVEARVEMHRLGERGAPDRWLESAPGGPALEQFACSAVVLDTLARATGVAWQPAGPGTWSYYRREGHHLGIHRDLAVCDLAVITCVLDQGGHGQAGLLRVWPARARESLDDIRRNPQDACHVRIRAGETVLLLGGIVPHQVLPVGPRQVRIVAPLCYQAGP